MDALDKIIKKFNLSFDSGSRMPIEIPDFGRVQMASLLNELEVKTMVEVGVRGGDYSEVLCKAIPGVKLYGVDPYIRIRGYRDITKQETFDRYEQEAHLKLDKYPNYRFIKKLSREALDQFADNSIDAVYIDGDHCFEEATFDIAQWSKKVKKGGIISGDDYFKHKGPARIHVYYVVNGYTQAWGIKPWFVLGSNAIIPGQVRDHGRSWMFIKP